MTLDSHTQQSLETLPIQTGKSDNVEQIRKKTRVVNFFDISVLLAESSSCFR
jgi:hypothetical protein